MTFQILSIIFADCVLKKLLCNCASQILGKCPFIELLNYRIAVPVSLDLLEATRLMKVRQDYNEIWPLRNEPKLALQNRIIRIKISNYYL